MPANKAYPWRVEPNYVTDTIPSNEVTNFSRSYFTSDLEDAEWLAQRLEGYDALEDKLRKLMSCFYEKKWGGVEWSYIEGTTLDSVLGAEFAESLRPYMVKG